MVNVKMHECFPTVISEFSYQPDLIPHNLMERHIKKIRKNHMYHTDDTLHNETYFLNLKTVILNANRYHLKKLDYEYEHLEMTGMWANHLFAGDAHPPHTHSNNFLSGVYYLKSGKNTSPIQFFDPRPQANVLRPRNKPNILNSSILSFSRLKPPAIACPPPDKRIPSLTPSIIILPISIPGNDLAEAVLISSLEEITNDGLWNFSFNLLATIPKTPKCQLS